jgi:hypothetical protein
MDWRQIERALVDACHDEKIPVGNHNGARCALVPVSKANHDIEVALDLSKANHDIEVAFDLTEIAKRLEKNGFSKTP